MKSRSWKYGASATTSSYLKESASTKFVRNTFQKQVPGVERNTRKINLYAADDAHMAALIDLVIEMLQVGQYMSEVVQQGWNCNEKKWFGNAIKLMGGFVCIIYMTCCADVRRPTIVDSHENVQIRAAYMVG